MPVKKVINKLTKIRSWRRRTRWQYWANTGEEPDGGSDPAEGGEGSSSGKQTEKNQAKTVPQLQGGKDDAQ